MTNDYIADANAFDKAKVHTDADADCLPEDLAANDMAEVEAAGRTLDAVTTAAQRAASAAISIRMDLGLGIHGEAGADHIPYAGAR